jgi:para-aminobenzoate synthetase/4-amino-4-deoxychorismate lyase
MRLPGKQELSGASPLACACFALLDDCNSTEQSRTSRLYEGWSHQHVCRDPGQLDRVLEQVEADLAAGLHAVVLADYEWGVCLARHVSALERDTPLRPIASADVSTPGVPSQDTLRVLMYRRQTFLSASEADGFLAQRDEAGSIELPSVAGIANLNSSVSQDQFDHALSEIRRALESGDSYQVNYTYRLYFGAFGTPLALYRRLRAAQPVPFGALIALPDDTWILSCSPELFVEHRAGWLKTRPMKGTAARSGDPLRESDEALQLRCSPKDRAENLMIVDLLRNDLGQVAVTGSVQVPALFSVEPHGRVWQMTSTVSAELRADLSFADVLRALFPCGSITGAPKRRTMALIDEVESSARGLYTGAIGWLEARHVDLEEPPLAGGSAQRARSCGNFCMSVAIRTVVLGPTGADGCRPGSMGVGAGIVIDSEPRLEYEECSLKSRFLTSLDPGFDLFETMWASLESGIRHLDRHLERLEASARQLGFEWDRNTIEARLSAHLDALRLGVIEDRSSITRSGARESDVYRLRLTLRWSGESAIRSTPLVDQSLGSPVRILLADPLAGFSSTQADDFLLRHKTTARALYDRAWQYAEQHLAFDMIFCNQRGEVTEGARSNIFVRLNGRWVTPPLQSGLLPGVMRTVLLEDRGFGASVAVVHRHDLERADALIVCNALRGALPAVLIRA